MKKSRIAAVAKDTEYYKIENVSVAFAGEVNKAKAITSLLHKKYGMKPESWEITLEFTKEAGEWKICATPGHKINP
jgi:spore coat polysaccharide biosynthesis protein SpsF (cytidylyltransferase family)